MVTGSYTVADPDGRIRTVINENDGNKNGGNQNDGNGNDGNELDTIL